MTKTQESVLFVDDEPSILSALRRLLRKEGYDCFFAESGEEGLAILNEEKIDLVISDMRMPNMNGAEFLSKVKLKWPETVRMLLTGHSDISATIDALNTGGIYRYISKPWDGDTLKAVVNSGLHLRRLEREKVELLELTREQNEQLLKFNDELEQKVEARTAEIQQTADMLDLAYKELGDSYGMFIRVLSSIVSSRVFIGKEKTSTVANLTQTICQAANFTEEESQQIYYAALLHEVGKLGLPDEILNLPESTLNAKQQRQYQAYPTIGEMTLLGISGLNEAAKIIRHHMERVDGEGYPDKLKGNAIHKGARLLRATHDFIGLQLGTVEKHAMSSDEAFSFLQQQAGIIYDAGVVNIIGRYKSFHVLPRRDSHETSIDSFNLTPGLITTRDVLNKNGILLISKGFKLTQSIIDKLLTFEKLEDCKLEIYVSKEQEE